MKNILLLSIILCCSVFTVNSQLNEYRFHIYGKASSGIIDKNNYYNIGASMEWMVKPKIGLNYNLEYQYRTDGYSQIHGSIGSLAGPPLFIIGLISGISNGNSWNTDNSNQFNYGYLGALAGVLLTICPDGVSYHFPIGYHWDVAPYANVLGIDWVINRSENYSKLKYSMSFGTKVSYSFSNNMTANLFIETRKVASTGFGIGGGFGIGFLLKKREDSEQKSDVVDSLQRNFGL